MAQSLSKIYVHLIFHIKSTSPFLKVEDLPRVHAYLAQLVKDTGCIDIKIGGTEDHVHLLFLLSKDESLSHVVEEVKRNSSRWIKRVDSHYGTFAWQNGYGAFSVSQSVVKRTKEYISNQSEHHKKVSFADEYRAFLKLYGVNYDERYVFRD